MTEPRLSLTDIADNADVRLSAVSNWRSRHRDFPAPERSSGQDLFDARQVAEWLGARRIPQNRLKPGEAAGTTYGDRFLRNFRPHDSEPRAGAPRPESQVWRTQLWAAANSLRDSHGTTTTLEWLLGLMYVRVARPRVWRALVDAATLSELDDVLAAEHLDTNTGPVPVFRTAGRADQAVREAIDQVDLIDLRPRHVAGAVADEILTNMARGTGRSGGHFTPPSVARCLVELLDPRSADQVYDPFCGSGELLCAAAAHVDTGGGWPVHGRTTHVMARLTSTMNLALHGVTAELDHPGDPSERLFDVILVNPAFNQQLRPPHEGAWPFGEPPAHNANFAWLQHVVTKLRSGGRAAVIMPAGAATTSDARESVIRRAMIESGVVDCVVALPPDLFTFTSIHTMVWVLRGRRTDARTLLVDARDAGEMTSRTTRQLTANDIAGIATEYRRWRQDRAAGRVFAGRDGFSHAADLDELAAHDHDLTPGRYVGAAASPFDLASAATNLRTLHAEFDELRDQLDELRVVLDSCLAPLHSGEPRTSGGQSTTLGAVCDVLPGPGTVQRSGHDLSWTPLVLPRNIRDRRIGGREVDVVPPATARKLDRYRLLAGDIVSARTGTLGRFGRVSEEQAGWLLGPGCVRLRPTGRVDPDYLTVYLESPAANGWLMDNARGTAIPYINTATLRTMPVWLPSPAEQREIVEVLSPFDEAAILHHQLNETTTALRHLATRMVLRPGDHPVTAAPRDR